MIGGSTTWSMGGIGHGRDPVWDGIHLGNASPASPRKEWSAFLTQTSTNMLYHEVNEVKNFPPCEDVQGLKVALWSIPATIINNITII